MAHRAEATPRRASSQVRVTSVLRFELTFVTELAGHIPVRVQRSADADGWLRACYDCRSRAEEERVMRSHLDALSTIPGAATPTPTAAAAAQPEAAAASGSSRKKNVPIVDE